MKSDHRLLHYMLSYLWLPRKGNHGVLTEEDAFILRVMWETHLGHGMLWTKVFEYLNLDLSGEEAVFITEENAITSRSLNKMGRGAVAARKGKKNKAIDENVPFQAGTSSNSQITSEAMEMFAERTHAFNIDWDKKMERVDKRLKVVGGRIVSQAKGLQSLEEGMNTHLSRNAQSGI
ncbi:hypothetical protein PIB30_069603 [Stylosanthes scabra]|uniref:Uncharacterized protein n=1 Tax=Stylosanthes scabra TaxID=79078 RepID=A0ABU6QP02_9FABA|nr:hypothetical protein [Stylosanthes scabra]